MAPFSSLALMVLEIWCVFKVKKTGHFLGKFPPYEILKSGDKISHSLVFWNLFSSSYFEISPESEPLDQNSSLTPFWKANLNMQRGNKNWKF